MTTGCFEDKVLTIEAANPHALDRQAVAWVFCFSYSHLSILLAVMTP
jgi:hypothetical protein